MTRRRTPTSIHNERPLLLGVVVLSAACLLALAVALVLGDQRTIRIALTAPGPGESVPSTIRSVSVTFDTPPDRAAVEARISVEPPVAGVVQWRGRTLEYVFSSPPAPGAYLFRLTPGAIGNGGERLRDPLALEFNVRRPGILVVTREPGRQRLLELREGAPPRVLDEGPVIRDYAIAPGGRSVSVVVSPEEGPARLDAVDLESGAVTRLIDEPDIDIGNVSWSTDGEAMLITRRNRLADGAQTVPRLWFITKTGEFISPLDIDGSPALAGVMSPDAQHVVYIAPANGNLIAVNLTTRDPLIVGRPRGGTPAWSPDSRMVAFDSVPVIETASPAPQQPIRVRSLDGTVDRAFGAPGELRTQPRFLDNETIMGLRRVVGERGRGTELLFESIATGQLMRAILLAPGTDLVLGWDLDPSKQHVVYAVQSGATVTVLQLDLESGLKTPVEPGGTLPRWLP